MQDFSHQQYVARIWGEAQYYGWKRWSKRRKRWGKWILSCSLCLFKIHSAYRPWNKHSTWNLMVGKTTFLLGRLIFRCYVSFRDGILQKPSVIKNTLGLAIRLEPQLKDPSMILNDHWSISLTIRYCMSACTKIYIFTFHTLNIH